MYDRSILSKKEEESKKKKKVNTNRITSNAYLLEQNLLRMLQDTSDLTAASAFIL